MTISAKWQTALAIAEKVAEVAGFLGVPYADDAEEVLEIAPGVIDDIQDVVASAKDAVIRVQTMFSGGGDAVTVATLSPEHIAAVETVHARFTTYAKLGHNPIDALPAAQ